MRLLGFLNTVLYCMVVSLLSGCGQVGVQRGEGRGDWTDQFEESTEYKWNQTIPMKTAKEFLGIWGE